MSTTKKTTKSKISSIAESVKNIPIERQPLIRPVPEKLDRPATLSPLIRPAVNQINSSNVQTLTFNDGVVTALVRDIAVSVIGNNLTFPTAPLAFLKGKKVSRVLVKVPSNLFERDLFSLENKLFIVPKQDGSYYADITQEYFKSINDDSVNKDCVNLGWKSLYSLGLSLDQTINCNYNKLYNINELNFASQGSTNLRQAQMAYRNSRIKYNLLSNVKNKDTSKVISKTAVIVEFLNDSEMMPESETYGLAGGVDASVMLLSGSVTASFDDIAVINNLLPFKISHTFRQSGENFSCGNNWRMNLHQSLLKVDAQNSGCDYIYVDGNGYKHGFIETYFYYNGGKKEPVRKDYVVYDSNSGRMYTKDDTKIEVFKEQKTTSGLKLTTRLDGFSNTEFYEQRLNEEKQLEEALYSYKRNLCDYVLVKNDSGQLNSALMLKFKNGILSKEDFNAFIEKSAEKDEQTKKRKWLILHMQEALQIQSLYKQKKIYEKQYINTPLLESKAEDSLDISIESLEQQHNSITMQYNSLCATVDEISRKWNNLGGEDESKIVQLHSLYCQFKSMGDIPSIFSNIIQYKYNNEKKYYIKGQEHQNIKGLENSKATASLFTPYDFEQKSLKKQKYASREQLKLVEKQITDTKDQKRYLSMQYENESNKIQQGIIDKQISHIQSLDDYRVPELKKLYKEYINCEENLEKLYKTTAISFLSDGNTYLCFNRYGELCALMDAYNNVFSVRYDIRNRISCIENGKKSINFEYSEDDLLKSIADFNGNRVEYAYDEKANLEKVSLPNGDTVSFKYSDDSDYLTKVSSENEKIESVLTYEAQSSTNETKSLKSIQNNSNVSEIKDGVAKGSAQPIVTVDFDYKDLECGITFDNKEKRYYMNDRGVLIGGCAKNDDGVLSYSYVSKDQSENKLFSIHEIDDALKTEKDNSGAVTIAGENVPAHFKVFMFSALVSAKAPFEMNAQIMYDDGTSITEPATENDNVFKAIQITLNPQKRVKQIKLSVECNESVKMIRLAPAAWTENKFGRDDNLLESTVSSVDFVCGYDDGLNRYRKTETRYIYDDEHHRLLTKKNVSTDYSESKKICSTTLINKYSYDDKGVLIREESYVEGEEATRGIMVDENILDDKGRIVKNKVYNTLESTSKKYVEKTFSENNESVQSEFDALGKNRISYEYEPATNEVAVVTYPSGSKFAYSRDSRSGIVTGISQSTEDGEANSIETHYTCGLVTRLTSRTNSINYEYNAKREKTAVCFNGVKKVGYEYENDVLLNGVSTKKTRAVFYGEKNKKIVSESFIDSKKNFIQATLDGKILFVNKYSKTNDLIFSEDRVTGVVTTTDYDVQNSRFKSISKSKGSDGYIYLDTVKEKFEYESYGLVKEHSIRVDNSGLLDHKYVFAYNDDTAKSLKSIELPNGLQFEPQKDFLGRDCGKILLKNGNKFLGEYISFRKEGDHTSDMISSIRYGEIKNGNYSISGGVRYKYDVCGNIIEKWENGKFSAAYAYDSLNRLVREDNVALQKTWLFSYDGNGNRDSKIELPFTRQKTSKIADYSNATIENYSYDGDMLVSCGENVFSYDGFGCPTKFKGSSLVWEHDKLKKYGDVVFEYDGYGKRIKKGSTCFIYDSCNNLILMANGEVYLDFIYDDRGLSGVKYQGENFVFRKNGQGDITHIFSLNDGKLVARYEYDAWGNHIVVDANGKEITDENHIGNVNPIRYRGYFYDVETKLYYLINRYYDPEIGRFISQDQINFLQPDVINGLNLFAYCGNNPVMRIDENGCSWKSFWKKVGNFFKKLGLAIAGSIIASVGFAVASGVLIASIPVSILSGNAIGNAITGSIFQVGMSIGMYGAFMTASAFSDKIYNDMAAIGWNPFNTDVGKVVDSNSVSFYKGIPVIRGEYDGERSGNLIGTIFLYKKKDEDEMSPEVQKALKQKAKMDLNHEFGHHAQQAILGPVNYLISVGIPSYKSWGKDSKDYYYYNMPWENMADAVGGVDRGGGHINNNANAKHLIICSLLGPFSLLYSASFK